MFYLIIRYVSIYLALNYEPPCPEGWYKYDEQCILVRTKRDVFNSARDYCRYLNSDLVVVKTQGLNVSALIFFLGVRGGGN